MKSFIVGQRIRLAGSVSVLLCVSGQTSRAQQAVIANRPAESSRRAAAVLNRPVTVQLDHVALRTAVEAIANNGKIRVQYRIPLLDAVRTPVTLRATNLPLGVAFDRILQGTTLQAVVLDEDLVSIQAASEQALPVQGEIVGKVINATTHAPISTATVALDDATRGVTTGEEGNFRLMSITPGTHTLHVRSLGYLRATKQIMVTDGTTSRVEISLEPSVTPLDQVVVTGTVVQTELKAVPNAITVITAKDLEQRGITKIDQLFRGDVPGLFAANQGSGAQLDEVTMFSRGATALSSSSGGTSIASGVFMFTNPIKTYVDGVELADPKYLSQLDPKSIERIEILTGPQASTIYGSNALNGVMQIFTKRGTSNTPQLTLNLLSGWVENHFSSAHTPQHDYSAQLNGIEGRLSYNAGGSWNYIGPWTPAKQTTRIDGFGGIRFNLATPVGQVTADVTLRRSNTQNHQRGDPSQRLAGYREAGWYGYSNPSASGLTQPTVYTLASQMLGMTLSYAPVSWWSHELGVGQDASDVETRRTARGYLSAADTTLALSQDHTDRRSIRYATTAYIPVVSFAKATITVGADTWQSLTTSLSLSPQTLTGSLTNVDNLFRQPEHNTGGFVQTQLSVQDRLFLTYGLRAEWNPNYGKEAQPNYAPRYGIAYTQDMSTPLGAFTAKLRGSYGRSTRPPQPTLKTAQTIVDYYGADYSSVYVLPYYGIFNYYRANPDLAPEHQQGGEGGLELYFSNRGSLIITRYNQTVDGLIDAPKVDSVRSTTPCAAFFSCDFWSQDADGYGYEYQFQNLNIGSIRNQGWELQSSVNMGPFTTKGTYSWTKSRTLGVNPKYRASFANQPQYRPGATFRFLPEHTWAFGVTYARAASDIGVHVSGTGRVTTQNDDFFLGNLDSRIRLAQHRLNISSAGRYVNANAGYTTADLTATQRVASHIEGVLQVQNLTNRYQNDFWSIFASMGRQVKLGARVKGIL